jgi:hypothetical protein
MLSEIGYYDSIFKEASANRETNAAFPEVI